MFLRVLELAQKNNQLKNKKDKLYYVISLFAASICRIAKSRIICTNLDRLNINNKVIN